MAAPVRIQKSAFILVPNAGDRLEPAVHAARKACRVATNMGIQPLCPLLYFLTFLSPGEFSMTTKKLHARWLKRSERIWLQFPDDEESLDSLSYDILERNRRKGWQHRRPVYQLHPVGDDFVAVPMDKNEVQDLLAINLTSGLASRCV